jgi:phospholipase C
MKEATLVKSFIDYRYLTASIVFALAACSGGSQSLPYMQGGGPLRTLNDTGAGKITHVIYIVQENRSFNDMFQGYPGALTRSYGYISNGTKVPLQPVPLSYQYVIDHSAAAMFAACNAPGGDEPGTHCRMNGFNNEENFGGPPGVKYAEYVYVPHKDSKPYFDMAHEWVLGDHMFQSHLDESFVSHQYIIAAQADNAVDLPYGAWGCPGGPSDAVPTITQDRKYGPPEVPCWDYTTLGDELDKAKLSWRFYASAFGSRSSGDGSYWSSYQAVKHIYDGPDWKKDVLSPNWKFITDVRHGKLSNFTWIVPVCDDSDHVNCPGGYGPSWVSALVNTVGESKFWNSTAIFVQWDDWGGLYDPVKPPYEDADGLGFRVPLLVISPYAKQNYVSHVQYETASVLRFAEDLYGLGQMAKADKRANSPAKDCFDFSQNPRPFVPIKAPLPPKFFMRQYPENYQAPDYE